MNNNYSVVFDGQKVPDHELFGVKQRLRELFKADRARIETLFAGKPVVIKHNLSRESAVKYQLMLRKAGVDVELIQVGAESSDTDVPTQSNVPPEEAAFSLAPVGSDLIPKIEGKKSPPPSLFRTDYLSLAPQQGDLIKPEERQKQSPVLIDSEAIDWELSQKGEDLLKESEKQNWQDVLIDTSAIDFLETNELLEKAPKTPAPSIKTDHLTLVSIDKTEAKEKE